MNAQWIWLDPRRYPDYQKTFPYLELQSSLSEEERRAFRYGVAELRAEFAFDEVPQRLELRVSGDTHFRFWINGRFAGVGPASAGGDFLPPKRTLDWYYANPYTLTPDARKVRIFAQVQLSPQVLTEFSYGQGGFYLEGVAVFADGTTREFGTDERWQARLNRSYCAPCVYDETLAPDAWHAAAVTHDARVLSDAPVKMLEFETVLPREAAMQRIRIHAGEEYRIEYDKIYGANLGLMASGACSVELHCCETEGVGHSCERVTLCAGGEYRSFRLHSVGECTIRVIAAEENVELQPFLHFVHYPTPVCGELKTSDDRLNRIFDLCRWTLKICRQTIHLDSTTHQELLACTGDYYIETLMTLFTFGDLSLSRGDVLRTAQWLVQNDGRMFHTNYSLIWVQMLELVYRFTADKALLEACKEALVRLLNRFETYKGSNGVIDNPPDYMFVDWMVTDGYSMHHPPKYLGQTVLNAFYYRALCVASDLAEIGRWEEERARWSAAAQALRVAFEETFYDPQRGLYIDGLPDATAESRWQPANPPRRHYSRYPNILAALYGLCDSERAKRLIRWAADDDNGMAPIQPYFMNFLLQAAEAQDLLREVGMRLLLKWMPSVEACEKGLQEGWYKPEEGYSFDHSHAWGGCPAYFIPQLLLGLRMLEPGYRRISLSPDLLGLAFADISFPTPFGMIRCELRAGQEPVVSVPPQIAWELV